VEKSTTRRPLFAPREIKIEEIEIPVPSTDVVTPRRGRVKKTELKATPYGVLLISDFARTWTKGKDKKVNPTEATIVLRSVLEDMAKKAGVKFFRPYSKRGYDGIIFPSRWAAGLDKIKAAFAKIWNDPKIRDKVLAAHRARLGRAVLNRAVRAPKEEIRARLAALDRLVDSHPDATVSIHDAIVALGAVGKSNHPNPMAKFGVSDILKREKVAVVTVNDVLHIYRTHGIDVDSIIADTADA